MWSCLVNNSFCSATIIKPEYSKNNFYPSPTGAGVRLRATPHNNNVMTPTGNVYQLTMDSVQLTVDKPSGEEYPPYTTIIHYQLSIIH